MRRHTPRAFTLVELLVVVGMIALLVGILLPTLSRAIAAARATADAFNLRQINATAAGYASENRNSLPFGLVALDANGRMTDEFLYLDVIAGSWADLLARWQGNDNGTNDLFRAPGSDDASTPGYGANPIAMPAPLLFKVRNTQHREVEKIPAKFTRLYPDNALFWSSASYANEKLELGASMATAVSLSGVDDGLAFGAYSGRNTVHARYRDRDRDDPVAADPLLASRLSIRIFDDEIWGRSNDRDFATPLTAQTDLALLMPARFRNGRCNVARADGGVVALKKGRLQNDELYDSEFRREMLKIKFPAF